MRLKKSDRVGMIVAGNIETASVFNYYGINFYSKGNQTLEDACIDGNIPMVTLLEDLSHAAELNKCSPDFIHMNMTGLSTYILLKHHRFAERKLVFIKHTLEKIISEYESERAILQPVKNAFEKLSLYLKTHMGYEETILFPFIAKMEKDKTFSSSGYRAMTQPIALMKEECVREVEKVKVLANVSRNYTIMRSNENIYLITYNVMMELENDLKIHMHLENNILFPKALDFARHINMNLN